MKDNFTFRVRSLYIVIFFLGALIVGRLFFLQVVNGSEYRNRASRQYTAPADNFFDRGTIYFQKKNGQLVSAATLKQGYVLAINPKILGNPEEVYEKILKALNSNARSGTSSVLINKKDFFARAGKKDDPYEEIIHKLNKTQAQAIRDLKLSGVDVFSETWRFYPAKNLASRVLGFVGYKGNKLAGRYGLERYYEDILERGGDDKTVVNAFAEIFTGIKKMIAGDSVEGDIVLTIEPTTQAFLDNTLKEVMLKYDAEMAGGIIIEPSTGKILAMSTQPDFEPNNYGAINDLSLFMNPMVQSIFEFGSIMKPLTLAAAMDQGAISPETVYNDKGYVVLDKRRIENYDGKARGRVNMQEVLNQSLNTGAVFAMQQLGKEKFRDYITQYGFGEKTGIDLPDEVSGMIGNMQSKRDIEYATASFGQGIAMTPVEMISALSALANGGVLMRPYVVEEIKIKTGIDKKTVPVLRRRVLKEETSEEISRMLSIVADKALLGGTVKLQNYSFAAKTGTAQMYREDGGGYYENEYLHSFFGYAPAFDAKFLTLLFLVKPQEVRYASHSLTEPFMNIVKFMINYYDIQPDR